MPWAAADVASRGVRGAAWCGAWRPAKAVLEVAEPLARRVEAARRFRSQIRGWPSSPEGKNRGGECRRLGKRGIGANE